MAMQFSKLPKIFAAFYLSTSPFATFLVNKLPSKAFALISYFKFNP
jgi:hypothetical protein